MSQVSQPIAFFDSGVGGLTVMHYAMQRLVGNDYIYYADSANVPYGHKSVEEITQLVASAIDNLKAYDPLALVIACNTATSVAIADLRSIYSFPIIGMEPAVRPAFADADPRRVLVLATHRTLQEKKYQDLITSLNGNERVDSLPTPELVEFAEEFDFDSPRLTRYLIKNLSAVEWDSYHSVILGCTHFSYFRQQIKRLIPDRINILDGIQGTVAQLQRVIKGAPKSQHPSFKVILSGHEVAKEVIYPYLSYLKKSPEQM